MAAKPSAWSDLWLQRARAQEPQGARLRQELEQQRVGEWPPSSAPGTGAGVSPQAR